MVEKAVDVKAKAGLPPSFGTRKIDSRCPKGYKPSVKKDKEYNANREYRNGDKDKVKPHNLASANSQP